MSRYKDKVTQSSKQTRAARDWRHHHATWDYQIITLIIDNLLEIISSLAIFGVTVCVAPGTRWLLHLYSRCGML
ncbi:hypothetical protein Pmani_034957 [Petrolisthes manimaculis]|uniref:Uncharacterized protein n=1 Tax=Petrolisthes manimaculis TaxID=1843537 RepID=A0AAE1TNV6_9EUCA|nr:hypothetical protein Pmani_034957 [Petrolisthes manimaculis]